MRALWSAYGGPTSPYRQRHHHVDKAPVRGGRYQCAVQQYDEKYGGTAPIYDTVTAVANVHLNVETSSRHHLHWSVWWRKSFTSATHQSVLLPEAHHPHLWRMSRILLSGIDSPAFCERISKYIVSTWWTFSMRWMQPNGMKWPESCQNVLIESTCIRHCVGWRLQTRPIKSGLKCRWTWLKMEYSRWKRHHHLYVTNENGHGHQKRSDRQRNW